MKKLYITLFISSILLCSCNNTAQSTFIAGNSSKVSISMNENLSSESTSKYPNSSESNQKKYSNTSTSIPPLSNSQGTEITLEESEKYLIEGLVTTHLSVNSKYLEIEFEHDTVPDDFMAIVGMFLVNGENSGKSSLKVDKDTLEKTVNDFFGQNIKNPKKLKNLVHFKKSYYTFEDGSRDGTGNKVTFKNAYDLGNDYIKVVYSRVHYDHHLDTLYEWSDCSYIFKKVPSSPFGYNMIATSHEDIPKYPLIITPNKSS